MHSATYVVGVDIGTTSTKAIVFDAKGHALAKHAVEYGLDTSQPSGAVQDPEEIFQAVITSVGEAVRTSGVSTGSICCVAFSSAMHSVIAMGKDGKRLSPCITWADTRGAAEAAEIVSLTGQTVYERTGTPVHPMAPLAKLRWMRKHMPEVFSAAEKFISIKEYVFYRLFGEYVVDLSIASATGLFDIFKLDWDDEALELAGVTRGQLSVVQPTTGHLSGMEPEYARQMGLPEDIPFVLGAGDGVLANLGVYAMEPGVAAATIGTSGAVRTVVDKPVTDAGGRNFCYALTDQHWVIGGAINNGGIALQWVRDELVDGSCIPAGREPYDWMSEVASTVRPGSEGLLFLPFLMGERAPYWNANARAMYFGIGMQHHRKHMIRAAFEGVIFQMYNVVLALEDLTAKFQEVRATGGFNQSPLWRQIMADIFGTTVTVPDNYESSCWGAALLGLLAMGHIHSLEESKALVRLTHTHVPNSANTPVYNELAGIYQRVYRKLEDEFASIVQIQNRG